jgi:hypothetical protein
MSISIIKQPQLYSPSENPIIYQFGTTYSTALYFGVSLYQYPTNYLILNDKAYVTPINPTGSEYNISDVMKSIVRWEINTSTASLVVPLSRPLNSYYLQLSTWGLSAINGTGTSYSVIAQLGATTSTDIKYTWNAKLDRNTFYNYQWQNYVANVGTTTSNISFLTSKPNLTSLNDNSFEQLYFLKSPTYSLAYNIIFYKNNAQSGMLTQLIQSTYSLCRMNVAPRDLAQYATSSYDYYDVRLITSNGLRTNSNTRRYYYVPTPCGLETVNVIWLNRFGGFDSYQFIQPSELRQAERTTIQKNAYKYDSSLNYTERVNNILNNTDEVINVNLNTSYKLWTRELSDDESFWIAGLLDSKQIFIEINDTNRSLYPVVITETDYTIQKRKYSPSAPIQSQFTFKITGDSISTSYSYESSSLISVTVPTTTSTTTTTTTAAPTPYNIGWQFYCDSNVVVDGYIYVYKNGAYLFDDTNPVGMLSSGTISVNGGDSLLIYAESQTPTGTTAAARIRVVDNGNTLYDYTQVGSSFSYQDATQSYLYTVTGNGNVLVSVTQSTITTSTTTTTTTLPPKVVNWSLTDTSEYGASIAFYVNSVLTYYTQGTATGSLSLHAGDSLATYVESSCSSTTETKLKITDNGSLIYNSTKSANGFVFDIYTYSVSVGSGAKFITASGVCTG